MQKIVLASVLKPVDDTRVYEKFGKSLAKLDNTEVIIFGTKSNDTSLYKLEENVRFEPYDINEKSTRRNAGRLFYKLLLKERPQHIIIHTIELLPFLIWYKLNHKTIKIYYDILENYGLNFKAQSYYSIFSKHFLSFGANLIESISFPFLDHIFSAEKIYLNEKKLPIHKTTVLENKYVSILDKKEKIEHQNKIITFCGTLSKAFGVLEFLNFVAVLCSCKNQLNYTFRIIGKAYENDVIQKLSQFEKQFNLELIGITEFVPHLKVIEVMQESDFVALPYPTNLSTKNCIPTKMYECMALGIPMIIQNNPFWKTITDPHQAGIFIDFNKIDCRTLKEEIENLAPYPNGGIKNAFWDKENNELRKVISKTKNE